MTEQTIKIKLLYIPAILLTINKKQTIKFNKGDFL